VVPEVGEERGEVGVRKGGTLQAVKAVCIISRSRQKEKEGKRKRKGNHNLFLPRSFWAVKMPYSVVESSQVESSRVESSHI
jgi:hypothetical protein